MATWQFVTDFNTATPSMLLDINTGSLMVGDGYNLDPPKYDKGYARSSMRHGARPTRSSAQNRILTIPLQVLATDRDAAATVIQNLGLQISKNNILKVQFGSTPVFFKTFADPDYALEVKKTLTQNSRITLQLEAEPFAYGVRVAQTVLVRNDPASGTLPCHFDITGVTGDVETPLIMHATGTGAGGFVGRWTHVGTRRRGTPSNYSNVLQAEDLTNGTDATDVADAAFSNGSKVRVSFATLATEQLRLSTAFPTTANLEARGEYIVYARVAKTATGTAGDITVRLAYGASAADRIQNDFRSLPAAAGPYWVNLGTMPVPMWSDPVSLGISGGTQAKVQMGFVGIYAARQSGALSLDIDCLYFMPADESTVIVKWPATDVAYVLDGTTDEGGSAYSMNTALDTVQTTATPPLIVAGGGFPALIPGQTNRIHMLRNVDPAGSVDAITNTTSIDVYYWPRWREPLRP